MDATRPPPYAFLRAAPEPGPTNPEPSGAPELVGRFQEGVQAHCFTAKAADPLGTREQKTSPLTSVTHCPAPHTGTLPGDPGLQTVNARMRKCRWRQEPPIQR